MKLSVYVMGRDVAVLEQAGDFKSVLTYHAHTAPDDFVSLTMPVRTESYVWDDQLPPVLQMNLPEGYLLQVLQEQFGPQIGAITGVGDWSSQSSLISGSNFNHLFADAFIIALIVSLGLSLHSIWTSSSGASSKNLTTRIDRLPKW